MARPRRVHVVHRPKSPYPRQSGCAKAPGTYETLCETNSHRRSQRWAHPDMPSCPLRTPEDIINTNDNTCCYTGKNKDENTSRRNVRKVSSTSERSNK
eukprot:6198007-Pleurochrysis_carterae.AAC.1